MSRKSSKSKGKGRGQGRGRGHVRSLVSQAKHIMRNGKHYGESKKVAHEQGKSQGRVYSSNTYKNYKSFILNMVKDVRQYHPEVKFIYEIKPEHVQEFVSRNAHRWNESTAQNHASDLNRFVLNAKEVHQNSWSFKDWDIGTNGGVEVYGLKGPGQIPLAISDRDAELIFKNMSSETPVQVAPQVMAALGVRVHECAAIEPRFIILPERPGPGNWGYVHLTETKNGRHRDVMIRSQEDYKLMAWLKDRAERNEWRDIWAGRSPRTIEHHIKEAMERAGLKEKYQGVCAHGFRKNYAKHGYQERLKEGRSEKSAWSGTQEQMGHSGTHRQNLFDRYAGAEEG